MASEPCTACKGKGYVKYGEGKHADFGKCPTCKGTKIKLSQTGSRLITAAEARRRRSVET